MSVRLFKDEEELSVGTGLDLESTFWRLRFQVIGQDSPVDAISELATDPLCPPRTTLLGKQMFRQPLTIRRLGHRLWESDVLYTLKDPSQFQVTVTGRTTGGTQKILGSFATVGTNAPTDQRFGGLIGYDPIKREAEGCEIIVPTMELDLEVTYPIGYASTAYLNGLADLTGTVNAAPWGGRQTGEVLYQGAEFTKGNQEPTKITHHVAIQPNIQGAKIADLSGINKEGWDYLWFLTYKDDSGKFPKIKAKYWYAERVYRRAHFAPTLGFSKAL